MAITTKSVWISKNALAKAPSGHTVNTAKGSIGTIDHKRLTVEITDIAHSASVNATKATAFDDLLKTELVTKLDTYVNTTLGLDDTNHTIQYDFEVQEVLGSTPQDNDNNFLLPDANKTFYIKGILNIGVS
jgi:hypothetical protein